MKISDLSIGDVCVTVKNDLVVILSVTNNSFKYPVLYKIKTNGTTYKGSPDFFKARVGQVDLKAFNEVTTNGPSAEMWEPRSTIPGITDLYSKFANLRAGDTIKVKVRGDIREGIFYELDLRKPKNPVLFELGGKRYKCPVNLVVWE